MAARKTKSPAWLYRQAEHGGNGAVASPEEGAGTSAVAGEPEPGQVEPVEVAEPVVAVSEGAAEAEARAESAPLPDEPDGDAMAASAAGMSDTEDVEPSVVPGPIVAGEPVAEAAPGPGHLEARQDEPTAAMPAALDGQATDAVTQARSVAAVPAPVALPDRAEIGARLARLRASRAEYAGDVHALGEALERYAQGYLLAEDSEVGRLRRQLAMVERERDELARQLRVAREAQALVGGYLRQLGDAIGGQPATFPKPDRELAQQRHDVPEVVADAD